MAKKKSTSKKSSNLGKILQIVATILGVVALIMMFVDTIKIPDNKIGSLVVEGAGYSGLKVAFGFKEDDVATFAFSFMGLLPYLLTLAGVVLAVVNLAGKKSNKLFDFIAAIAFVVAGVLFFFMPNFVVCADTVAGFVASKLKYVITIGAVVSAVASLLAGATLVAKNLLKK